MRLKEIFSFLPQGLCALLDAWGEAEGVAELRLRAEKVASLSLYREGRTQNILLPFTATYGHIQEIVERLCGGSVYAHEDSIRQGYIKLSNGCRVGLGGEGVTENGRLLRLLRVTFLVFRLPKRVPGAAAAVLRAFRLHGCQRSALVIAPPCAGKTTVLREFAREISRGKDAKRTVLLDSRGEFGSFEKECLIDVLEGYPLAEGIEIAIRTLSPEVLVCDEIGRREAEALSFGVRCGVPVVASAHGESLQEVWQRQGVGDFIRGGVFPLLYLVGAQEAQEIQKWQEERQELFTF